ncbi:unnamed protein product [Schistosoma mattheei]|uniref:Uncharacterized protein n=1 Tax=Schistosoma mattheei TaxID=31246 RepID=A0A3P8H960_9TREM|nr:unnamed protein product [Schistosoma mattheei]
MPKVLIQKKTVMIIMKKRDKFIRNLIVNELG